MVLQKPLDREKEETHTLMLIASDGGYYTIVTDNYLDRESVPEYNVTITVSDQGSPPLSTSKNINIKISDVNDSPPKFHQSEYSKTVPENNSPGFSVFTVSASDADWGQNARVSYFLEEKEINGVAVSSFVSVNSENGVIHAVRSFDYEQIKSFVFNVTARDAGSPPLSSVATVSILIQDQNDNAPQVLYPVQTGGSVLAEMVPRSADVGYLVTKVVAVDVDSGQNAWLSYKVHKATDRALFEVGLHNGEIRTVRQVTDKDAVKQRLTVLVEDNGQPSRSATVIVNVAVADSFPEVLSEFTDFSMHDKEYNDKLTFYLVLALAVVSFLFITCLLLIISVKVYRWRQSRILYHSNLPVIPYYPPRYSDTLGTGTLPHVYNYEVCRTTDSRKSDMKNMQDMSQSLVSVDGADADTPHVAKQLSGNCGQIRYSIPEEMKKGSIIGNVAQDLGLEVKRLISGRARILTEDNIQYTELKTDKGVLAVNERIDREQLCGDVTPYYEKDRKYEVRVEAKDQETGVLSAVRSFDYEQIKHVDLVIRAQDGGSPPLSSNVSVRILIQDQNDNTPQVLYPVQTGGSVLAEMVPRSADVGYLVTKVVAVDVDSGQNAWLSYKVHKATDRALFEVGLHNGEIRTVRQVTDKDAVKQRLTVLVEDNGQPSRSATVIVNVAVADSFPEVLSEFTDFSMHDKEYNDKLTFYLVLALAVVSFLFITCLLLIISVKVYRWRQSRILYHSNLPVIPYYPPRYSDTLGTGTLQHVYNYEVCRTTDSRKSDMKNMQALSQSLVSVDGADADTSHVTKQLSGNCSQMSTLWGLYHTFQW
ncbi:protocadherin beta-11-like [Dunckerocampus dactyliophorus]|uniref:protocadherin beta-11-like n=1 Tax=Dunckerocampus dactyliophorus TaxID=161453 RepID=UPI0024050DB0|nr:protocadherin beta-11-like [Dunckerocampus dactyliophorus]